MSEHTKGELRIEKEHDLWLAIYTGHGLRKKMFADCVHERDAERLILCWNEHDTLKAKADLFDEMVKGLEFSLDGLGRFQRSIDQVSERCNLTKAKWEALDKQLEPYRQLLARAKEIK